MYGQCWLINIMPLLLILSWQHSYATAPVGLDAMKHFELLPYFKEGVLSRQFSSHDRTGGNSDGGTETSGIESYLYREDNKYVIFDVQGPGCIYRIWFTGLPSGNIQFYFDDEDTPRVDMDINDFFSGSVAPFLTPLVGNNSVSSGGFYCYLPLPFTRSCRIMTTNFPHYYNIDYQIFASTEGITTFTGRENSLAVREMWNRVGIDPKDTTTNTILIDTVAIAADSSFEINIDGPGCINSIKIKIPQLTSSIVTDDGRAHMGYSQFKLRVAHTITGIRIKRRLDYGVGNQVGAVYIDGDSIGIWSTPGTDPIHKWRDSELLIPLPATGKDHITVKIKFVSSNYDWNEFHYWLYSLVGEKDSLTDELDVGNTISEAAHEYTIFGQTWAGVRTFLYPSQSIDNTLNKIWLQIYWDDESTPSVNTPIGEFFGSGLGEADVRALPVGMTTSDDGFYYCYFPMPYNEVARIVFVNKDTTRIDPLIVQIQYDTKPYEGLGTTAGYFHAIWRSEYPTTYGHDYTILETTGKGHLVGCVLTMSSVNTAYRWYLEGDERLYIDGNLSPQLYGTGTEDFFNGGWYFQYGPFTLPVHGNPIHVEEAIDHTGCYRFFLSDCIPFNSSIKLGIEHGPQNDAVANYSSVAYWYGIADVGISLCDELDVGDTASEATHNYHFIGETWAGTQTYFYEGDADNVAITDDGRALIGACVFTVSIPPSNEGIRLRRRLDQSVGRQRANVYIDNNLVGTWYTPEHNTSKRWLDSDFEIPPPYTKDKEQITVKIEVSSPTPWYEFHYWVFAHIPAQTGIEERQTIAANPIILLNYPNPFSQSTVIKLELPITNNQLPITLAIYDLLGRIVRTLVDEPVTNFQLPITIIWDGCDDNGKRVAPGIYFCQIKVDGFTKTKKMVILR